MTADEVLYQIQVRLPAALKELSKLTARVSLKVVPSVEDTGVFFVHVARKSSEGGPRCAKVSLARHISGDPYRWNLVVLQTDNEPVVSEISLNPGSALLFSREAVTKAILFQLAEPGDEQNPKTPKQDHRVKLAIKRAQDRHGKHIKDTVGPVIWEALVAREALAIISSQHAEDANTLFATQVFQALDPDESDRDE